MSGQPEFMRSILATLFALLAGLLVAACGSATSGIAGTTISGTGDGTETLAVVSGTLDQFGSIVVNGIRFDVSAAAVDMEGDDGSDSDLKLGMWVNVYGEANVTGATGNATRIEYRAPLAGPVKSFDSVTGELSVQGVQIMLDANTHYAENFSSGNLIAGVPVAVSGNYNADGIFEASFIEPDKKNRIRARGPQELRPTLEEGKTEGYHGYVQELLPPNQFVILNTTVRTNDSTVLDGYHIPPRPKDQVSVAGRVEADGSILAQKIWVFPVAEDLSVTTGVLTAIEPFGRMELDGEPYYGNEFTRIVPPPDGGSPEKDGLVKLLPGAHVFIRYGTDAGGKRVIHALSPLPPPGTPKTPKRSR